MSTRAANKLIMLYLQLPHGLCAACAGRHKAFSSLGLDVSSFQQAGTLMALTDLSLQYKAPLRSGDLFYITSAVAQVCAAHWQGHHHLQQVELHGSPGALAVVRLLLGASAQ